MMEQRRYAMRPPAGAAAQLRMILHPWCGAPCSGIDERDGRVILRAIEVLEAMSGGRPSYVGKLATSDEEGGAS